jgi:hypothetical protein
MPVQYYLPRNELTYRHRYTKNGVCFKHYVQHAPNFLVCCIAALIDQQPLSWECHTLIDFLIIFVEGASQKGYSVTTFFKEESNCGTLPEIVEIVHYAYCLFGPSQYELVSLKTHIRLFQNCSLIQYIDFLKQRWDSLKLDKLDKTSVLFHRIQ